MLHHIACCMTAGCKACSATPTHMHAPQIDVDTRSLVAACTGHLQPAAEQAALRKGCHAVHHLQAAVLDALRWQCAQETLRLYPPAPGVVREADKAMTIDGEAPLAVAACICSPAGAVVALTS